MSTENVFRTSKEHIQPQHITQSLSSYTLADTPQKICNPISHFSNFSPQEMDLESAGRANPHLSLKLRVEALLFADMGCMMMLHRYKDVVTSIL